MKGHFRVFEIKFFGRGEDVDLRDWDNRMLKIQYIEELHCAPLVE
jgi:hypothetical protein